MGNNFLSVLLATARAKITPIVTKIRLWTSWNFIRTRLIARLRNFFSSILDIKPRHKADYYEIFGWLVSRRLIFAIMVILGVISGFYLFSLSDTFSGKKMPGAVAVYDYDDLLLRFAKGKVKIRGKSGYTAYEGNVSKGAVNGFGVLYAPEGNIVYQGNFENNRYQGNGTLFYEDGTKTYIGNFEENLYQGMGKLYRENGSLKYDGEFHQGKMEGSGKLYDTGNNLIYQGSFQKNEILYSELLGKKTGEVKDYYKGSRKIYETQDEILVFMDDIDAVYLSKIQEEALDDSAVIHKILVRKDSFGEGAEKCESISDLDRNFETKIYEGNSSVTIAEALAINSLVTTDLDPVKKVKLDTEELYQDYTYVNSLEEEYTVFIDSYYKDGLVYTFVRDGDEEGFLFYTVEAEGGAG